MSDVIISEKRNGVGYITINRPDKLNALNAEVLHSIYQVLVEFRVDVEVRCVVITGSGTKAFAAGADIAELHSQEVNTGRAFALNGQNVFNTIERLGKPVIAAVNGYALGGGCELAMSCHIRIASENATFGQPEINLGIIPGYGGTQRLPRLIGGPRALEMILSGVHINAETALQFGLVNKVLESADLMSHTTQFAESLAQKAPLALEACLQAVLASADGSVLEGQLVEAQLFGNTCGTSDFKEGTAAFLEKRKPSFTGA